MTFMTWDDSLNTGIAEIDRQHRWLFDLSNRLYDSMSGEGKENAPIHDILEQLMDYAMNHFVLEEELFQRLRYPESAAHAAEHNHFSRQVMNLLERCEKNEAVSEETLTLLKDWLIHHIARVDKAYIAHFRSHGITDTIASVLPRDQ